MVELEMIIIGGIGAILVGKILLTLFPMKDRRVQAFRDGKIWLGWQKISRAKSNMSGLKRLLAKPARIKLMRWRIPALSLLLATGIALVSGNPLPFAVFLIGGTLPLIFYNIRKNSASESYLHWFGLGLILMSRRLLPTQQLQVYFEAWKQHPDSEIRLLGQIGLQFLPNPLAFEQPGTLQLPLLERPSASEFVPANAGKKAILAGSSAMENMQSLSLNSEIQLLPCPEMPSASAYSGYIMERLPMEELMAMAYWIRLMPDVICIRCKQHAEFRQDNPIPLVVCPSCQESLFLIGPIKRLVGHLQEDYQARILDGNFHFPISTTNQNHQEKPELLLIDEDFKGNVNAALASYMEFLYNQGNEQRNVLKIINNSSQKLDANLLKILGKRVIEA